MVWINYRFGSKLMAEGFQDKALGSRLFSLHGQGWGVSGLGFGLKVVKSLGFRVEESSYSLD